MYNIRLSKYVHKHSLIHIINPTIKLICLILFLITILISSDYKFILVADIFVLILMLRSNISIIAYLKQLLKLSSLLITIFILNLIFKVNINTTIVVLLKIITTFLYSLVIITTTKPNHLVYSITKILKPLSIFKINVNSISLIISMSIRFISVIIDEALRIIKSLSLRGINFTKKHIFKNIKNVKYVFVPLFSQSMKRADSISEVMILRNYNSNIDKTVYKLPKIKRYDIFILFIHILILVVYIVKEVI